MYQVLNKSSITDLMAYHKGLYQAFIGLRTWPERNYERDEKYKLLFHGIDEYEEVIYVLKNKIGEIYSACSINFNMSKKLQLERMGFCINKQIESAEVLHLYILDQKGKSPIRIGHELLKIYKSLYIDQKLSTLFATCPAEKIKLYEYFHWQRIDYIKNSTGKTYLLQLNTASL